MPKSKSDSDIKTPAFGSLTHEDIKYLFKTVINIVEPSHPYHYEPYPVNESEIDYSYKKKNSSYYASCGPRKNRNTVVGFSADKYYFNHSSPEHILGILVHEVTHVTVGRHSSVESGSHPPRFWREFGFNAHIMLDSWDEVEQTFGPVSKRNFIGNIIKNEVTTFNIDNRYGSEMLRKQEMARWFKNTLKNEK
jgi:hypothetical protein